jgi:dynein heavy chain
LVDDKDRENFVVLLSEKLGTHFDQTFHNICPNKQPPIFSDFINPDLLYEDLVDFPKVKSKMEEVLRGYNEFINYFKLNFFILNKNKNFKYAEQLEL